MICLVRTRGMTDDFVSLQGCSIDAMNSFDGEVALEALYEAVRQKDYRLVHRLLARGMFAFEKHELIE